MVELVNIDAIHPSTYNPRLVDTYRLELIALSLRKLGFVLPIYATPEGEILSGHQRHLVASQFMGMAEVPVSYTDSMPLEKRRNVNVLFNRGTNDMDATTSTKKLKTELAIGHLQALAAKLPDREGHGMYRCLHPRKAAIKPLLRANKGRWRWYATNVSERLRRNGVKMPLVVNQADNRVVNGIGRLELAAKSKEKTVEVIYVSPEEAEFTDAMLNFLSMDFDIHTRYADVLRRNSFRHHSWSSYKFGNGYANVLGKTSMSDFNLEDPKFWAYFNRRFGKRLLDMGAGHHARFSFREWFADRFTTKFHAFEPYVVPDDTAFPDPAFTRETAQEFLAAVRDGVVWNSIVSMAVLNSIPFDQDRRYFLAICSSLCAPHTTYYMTTSGISMLPSTVSGADRADHGSRVTTRFALDYEPNVSVAALESVPKVQKFFHKHELKGLLEGFWQDVTVVSKGTLFATAAKPRLPDFQFLANALAFEFDVPYPGSRRLGLAEAALYAFSERLGVKLAPSPKGDDDEPV